MSSPAAHERRALVTALRKLEPDAPTLCEGWEARDVAAHIATRDSRPDAMLGEKLPVLGAQARQTLDEIAALDYPVLLDRIEQGPPRRSPVRLRPLNNLINTVEFFVHTEDVRRAQPNYTRQQSRHLPLAVRRRLWKQGSTGLFVLAATQQRGRITFISPGFGAVTVGRASRPLLLAQGTPEELVLWAFGRREAADVDLSRPQPG